MQRRAFLKAFGGAACSVAAHPFLTTVTLAEGAASLGENRLIVVILRGAMDGLDVLQPRFDPAYLAARPGLAALPGLDLAQGFQLHGALSGLMPLWEAKELGFVHATSTPYRDKRSHFDGQDILEAGTGTDVSPAAHRDGWLNRLLQTVPGVTAQTAYAVGRDGMLILSGAAQTRSWAPDQDLALSGQGRLLLDHVAHEDPLFRDTIGAALELTSGGMMAADTGDEIDGLVDFTAERLRNETRIASFSLTGWDSHQAQERLLRRPLDRLARVITRMKEQLGADVWGKTAVLAMTEFGRTLRENGSAGTDHGTGGVMLAAGGAVRGGQILGRWPGLEEASLYQRRDLLPTSDVRDWAGQAMRGLYGLDQAVLENAVFPGLRMKAAPGLFL